MPDDNDYIARALLGDFATHKTLEQAVESSVRLGVRKLVVDAIGKIIPDAKKNVDKHEWIVGLVINAIFNYLQW